jgi:hypothetical protein
MPLGDEAFGDLPQGTDTPEQITLFTGVPLIKPFERAFAKYSVNGTTRVEWVLSRLFVDPQPHTFTLQGAYSSTDNDEFEDIGLPAQNTYFLEDAEKRVFAQTQDYYYRVKLVTPVRTYYSEIVSAFKNLQFRDWRLSREILRKESLRHSKYTSLSGYLLKRRRYGERCTNCTDRLTEEVTDSNCPVCEGTGLIYGYFTPIPAFMELSLHQQRENLDKVQAVGMQKDMEFKSCRMLGDPVPDSYDVFVDSGSDRRFIIHEIISSAEIRGYPIATMLSVRQANFSDKIYSIEVPGA